MSLKTQQDCPSEHDGYDDDAQTGYVCDGDDCGYANFVLLTYIKKKHALKKFLVALLGKRNLQHLKYLPTLSLDISKIPTIQNFHGQKFSISISGLESASKKHIKLITYKPVMEKNDFG
ncbi:hypothetical protein BpHYR1_027790 [Brachionus plicatilis]|uniref:Uncharacterized protein n=1 Tax=Brachionus plicatilis TaxID=10195 RepID=A0A3M7RUW9_BRAPC|nr:hypothetical protein BpHYR1_027790 [Brachionus plicatilis]